MRRGPGEGGAGPRGAPRAHLAPCTAGRAQANEQRYSKLKEKYSELVQNHADLLRKVGLQPPAGHRDLAGPAAEHLLPSLERRSDQAGNSGKAGSGRCGTGEEGAGGFLPAGERAVPAEGE